MTTIERRQIGRVLLYVADALTLALVVASLVVLILVVAGLL